MLSMLCQPMTKQWNKQIVSFEIRKKIYNRCVSYMCDIFMYVWWLQFVIIQYTFEFGMSKDVNLTV